jgi:hypothetical protein
MLYALKIYLRDLFIWLPLTILVGLLIFVWWFVVTRIHPTDTQIFLHYNIIFGVDLAGSWQKMYYLPAGATIIMLVNYCTSFFLYRTDKVLARLLTVLTVPVEIFLIYAIVLIVGLNT